MSRDRGGRLSGARFNRILEHGLRWYRDHVEALQDEIMNDGYPPFSVPLSEAEQFQRLLAWQMAGDPRYWQSPDAQRAFARLAVRFGADVLALPLSTGTWPGGGPV